MDTLTWIFTGFTLVIAFLSSICVVALPVLILGGLGIFLYHRNKKSTSARQAAQTWSSTSGMVLLSSVQSRRSGHSITTYPVVVYQYEVNGSVYQGKIIRVGEQFLDVRVMGQAHATAARYPVGAQVTVYYNPNNPAEAALER